MTYQVISARQRPTEFDRFICRFVLYSIVNMPVFHALVGFNSRTPGVFLQSPLWIPGSPLSILLVSKSLVSKLLAVNKSTTNMSSLQLAAPERPVDDVKGHSTRLTITTCNPLTLRASPTDQAARQQSRKLPFYPNWHGLCTSNRHD